MQSLNPTTQEFLHNLKLARKMQSQVASEEVVDTSKVASTLAIVYETARNAIEFRADHLVRQGAINRILKRRFLLQQTSQKLASLLIKELIWAHYLEESVALSLVDEVAQIIERYAYAISHKTKLSEGVKRSVFEEWLVGLASCEIEEKLVFDPIPKLLTNFVFESLIQKIDFKEEDPETKNVQIYIAVERGFSQNNETFISYRLMKTVFPGWFKAGNEVNQDLINQLIKSYQKVTLQLNYPLKEQLRRTVINMSPPFNLVRELINEYPEDVEEVIKDSGDLEEKATLLLEKRYQETKEKLSRASTRSIVYIFLTKMVMAFLLELPFDLLLRSVNYLALGINTLFPPFLMFLLNIDVRLPDKKNTEKMVQKIKDYFYKGSEQKKVIVNKKGVKSSIQKIFFYVYMITFVLIFGGIIRGLMAIHFNIISQLIFLFFLTVVSFFAYRIRGIAKEYMLQDGENEGIIGFLFDFAFLPVIKVGQWLSTQISRFNLLSFIFDFIIEAPLKAFLEIIEEWVHFVRTTKEEIVT